MATLKDVARETGLTVSTVSRVLNNRGYISKEAREKVYEAMKKLNYQPNEEEQAPFQNALRGTNQSSQLAQMIAESTQIFQDDTMMKEEDIGEN